MYRIEDSVRGTRTESTPCVIVRGTPSQSRCARQLPQRGSQEGVSCIAPCSAAFLKSEVTALAWQIVKQVQQNERKLRQGISNRDIFWDDSSKGIQRVKYLLP